MLESTLNKIVLLAALGKEQEMKRVKSTLLCFVQIDRWPPFQTSAPGASNCSVSSCALTHISAVKFQYEAPG